MQDDAFDPESTSVTVGDTVTFENKDGHDHNVQGDGIDIEDFDSGSQEFTPEKAGTIEYECTIHEGMTGTLEVEDA